MNAHSVDMTTRNDSSAPGVRLAVVHYERRGPADHPRLIARGELRRIHKNSDQMIIFGDDGRDYDPNAVSSIPEQLWDRLQQGPSTIDRGAATPRNQSEPAIE